MKTRHHWELPAGRIAAGQPRPLHVRLEVENGVPTKIALGVQVRPEHITWQLYLAPHALTAILERVQWATEKKADA